MPEKAKVPAIRFKGFTDAWEQRKLSHMTDYKNGKGHEDRQSDRGKYELVNLNSISIDGGLKHSGKFVDITEVTLLENDLVMVLSDVGHGDLLGRVALIPENDRFVLNQRVALLRPNETVDPQFMFSYINAHQQYFKSQGAGMSQLNISKGSVESFTSYVPHKEEQSKIGSFFTNLDNLITLHQRKFEKLHNVKKAMLEKMFPENGNNVPEIRFAGFTDAWEQRKFSDNIISIQTGTNLLGGLGNTGIPLLKMGNIQRGYFSLDKIEYLDAKDEVEKENIAYYGDFFFNTRNTLELVGKGATWTGESGKYAFNSNIARFVFKDIDTIFFNYLYNTQNMIKQVNARAMGTTSVAAIYPRNLNSVEYKLPSLEEQNKIGLYFQNLDNLITLHQRKLEKLKNIKKACLEKMFV